eukprot:2489883-Rhodomonas_salina.3
MAQGPHPRGHGEEASSVLHMRFKLRGQWQQARRWAPSLRVGASDLASVGEGSAGFGAGEDT